MKPKCLIMTPPSDIQIGELINVYEWRNDTYPCVTVIAEPQYHDDGTISIDYECHDGSCHYAMWVSEKRQWESGDI